jgi:hypothetical protein
MHALTAFMEACLEGDAVRKSTVPIVGRVYWRRLRGGLARSLSHCTARCYTAQGIGWQPAEYRLIAKRHVVQAFQLRTSA